MSLVRDSRIIPYDLFPQGNYKPTVGSKIEDVLEKQGGLYRDYLEQAERTKRIRNACAKAMRDVNNLPKFPMMKFLACYIMGANNCGELSTAALVEVVAKGKIAAQVTVVNPENNLVNHAFIICGESSKHLNDLQVKCSNHKKVGIIELKSLDPETIIIDPFLNVAFLIKHLADSVLDNYCKEREITQVFRVSVVSTSSSLEEAKQIKSALMAQVERIVAVAKPLMTNL